MGNKVSAATDGCCGPPVPDPCLSCYQPRPRCSEPGSPGTFEDLHKDCKDLFPNAFDGAKLMVNKALTRHMHISHAIQMTTAPPIGGYKFGCTYVGDTIYGPSEAYPVLSGEIDPCGNMNAQLIHKMNDLTLKYVTQIQNTHWYSTQLYGEYKGPSYTAAVTMGNIDMINRSGVLVSQYLQSVYPNISVGAEFLYQYGSNIPGKELGVFTLASKYTGDNWVFCGCITPIAGGVNCTYYQKASDVLKIGLELQGGLRTREICCAVGYQIDMPNCGLLFKGQFDSNWCVAGVMEKKLNPMPFSLILSGFANHAKKNYKFGIGFTIGE